MKMRQQREKPIVRRCDAGFGLIEVVVAIVLLAVGVLSVSQVLTQSVSMQTVTATRTTALDVARATMEDVKSRDPLSLADEAAVQVNDQGQPDASGVFTRELQVDAAGNHLIEVTVIVTTPRSSPISLVTWIYDGQYQSNRARLGRPRGLHAD